jgi:hypothetical protein
MIRAHVSDETKAIGFAFATAFVAAVGTALGAWGVKLAERALKVEPPAAKE